MASSMRYKLVVGFVWRLELGACCARQLRLKLREEEGERRLYIQHGELMQDGSNLRWSRNSGMVLYTIEAVMIVLYHFNSLSFVHCEYKKHHLPPSAKEQISAYGGRHLQQKVKYNA